MPAIATIGTKITVTPYEGIQIISGPGVSEFSDDTSSFCMQVNGILHEESILIGVYGPVISGAERFHNLTVTLIVRLEGANWKTDNLSAANFKVGNSVARPNGKHVFYHPEGSDIEGFPFFVRYAAINSRIDGEPEVNAAMKG